MPHYFERSTYMIDYPNSQKKYFTKKMPDETVLNITMPKKRLYEEIESIAQTKDLKMDELYDIAAKILSNNIAKKTFSAEDVDEMYEIDGVISIVNDYASFVSERLSNPN